jgi:hypothetical protein
MIDVHSMSCWQYRDYVMDALADGELEHIASKTATDVITKSGVEDRLYRRKPKPRRIKGYIAVDPDHWPSFVYPTEQEARDTFGKDVGVVIIPIDCEVPK